MRIRVATSQDRENIREIHLRAFPESERQSVSALAVNLLSERASPGIISLVAEHDGTLVGHIAFSPVTVENDGKWRGYILAPLGVRPEWQNRHIGSSLIASGMAQLSENGINVLFVYGDPMYYSKFGFRAEAAAGYLPPYELQYPSGWQAVVLNETGHAIPTAKISCVASLHKPELW